MNAYKMKEIADKINAERKYEVEKKFYTWLMGEMEVVARNGKYKYEYEFNRDSPDFDIDTIVKMLQKEEYRTYLYFEDYTGLEVLKIEWSDLQ
jgi:hypothetical protein